MGNLFVSRAGSMLWFTHHELCLSLKTDCPYLWYPKPIFENGKFISLLMPIRPRFSMRTSIASRGAYLGLRFDRPKRQGTHLIEISISTAIDNLQ